MLFKPKFCCGCGEKIERLDWKPWTSRRFCQLCATEFGLYDWIPRIVFGLGLFFGILGVSFYWQKPAKPLNALNHQISDISLRQANKNLTNQTNSLQSSTNQNVQETAKLNDSNSGQNVQKNLQAALLKQSLPQTPQIKRIENGKDAPETSYFCGAQTKKGTPCARRVKSNSRCFQHVGQSAMLPPEKLKIN